MWQARACSHVTQLHVTQLQLGLARDPLSRGAHARTAGAAWPDPAPWSGDSPSDSDSDLPWLAPLTAAAAGLCGGDSFWG